MDRIKEIEILMKDRCTKSEAEKALSRGTSIFEDFEEHFNDYMKEWECDEDQIAIYKEMIQTKEPATDWGIIELEGKIYYIMYTN